jgi:DNA-binding response OmpR family regulator
MGLRVLIAEDDPRMRAMLQRGLGYQGFEILEAADGLAALRLGIEAAPDLVVLDIGLPGMDGLEVCRRLRAARPVPILVLTARGELSDRVAGLRGGADDYLVKPFAFQELTARLEALARRSGLQTGERLRLGDIELDLETATASRAGRRLVLKPRERELLELLLRHPGQVLGFSQVWRALWGEDRRGESNALNVAVSGLRRALGEPPVLETVRSVGYRLGRRAP